MHMLWDHKSDMVVVGQGKLGGYEAQFPAANPPRYDRSYYDMRDNIFMELIEFYRFLDLF